MYQNIQLNLKFQKQCIKKRQNITAWTWTTHQKLITIKWIKEKKQKGKIWFCLLLNVINWSNSKCWDVIYGNSHIVFYIKMICTGIEQKTVLLAQNLYKAWWIMELYVYTYIAITRIKCKILLIAFCPLLHIPSSQQESVDLVCNTRD